MGLLDEAIREHLELKRRRGADPGEIARQEREALGPARRPGEAAVAGGEPVAAAPAAGEWEETPEVAPVDEPLLDDVDEAEDEDDSWDEADDDVDEIESSVEPSTQVMEPAPRAVAPTPPAPSPARDTGQPTSEYDVLGEDERPAEPASFRAPQADEPVDDADDVLEETPEFLQETPEHDRLWFEQRPPRDFDFDG
jgi:hypothetical protein